MSDGRFNYGPSLAPDRSLRYVSPSSLDSADTRTEGGCLRRFFYERVMKLRPPQTKGQETGVKGHAEIEHYLKTGEDVLGTIVRRGKHMIPAPGSDLLIEQAIAPPPPGFDARKRCIICRAPAATDSAVGCGLCGGELKEPEVDPRRSLVYLAGVPVVAYLDLAHRRGVNIGADDVTDTHDPPGTIEVIDWKFLSDPHRYAKTADEVSKATPMLVYARGIANALERAGERVPEVRLSHCYFGTRERDAFKRTKRVALPVVDERLAAVESVVREMADVARAASADDVPGNTRACHAFRGCHHREYCLAGQRGAVERFFGRGPATPKETTDMSVLNSFLPGALPGAAAPAATPSQPVAAAPVAPPPHAMPAQTPSHAPVVSPAGVGVALNLTPAGVPAQPVAIPSPSVVPPGFAEAWQTIADAGFGFPTVNGAAGDALCALMKYPNPPGLMYNGTDRLLQAGVILSTVEDVIRVAGELKPHADANRAARAQAPAPAAPVYAAERAAAAMPAIAPPDVPASNPALAGTPIAPMPGDPPAAVAAMQAAQQAAQAPAAVASADAPPMPVETTAPKKRGAKKATAAAGRKGGETSHDTNGIVAQTGDTLDVYVDCIPDGPYTNLYPHVQVWCDEVVKALGGVNCPDIRLAHNDSPLGFGKWRAILEQHVCEQIAAGALAGGAYALDARGSEIGEVVAGALRKCADRYARGR